MPEVKSPRALNACEVALWLEKAVNKTLMPIIGARMRNLPKLTDVLFFILSLCLTVEQRHGLPNIFPIGSMEVRFAILSNPQMAC